MFKDYKIYGPYFSQKEKRRVICLVPKNKTSKRTTISFARYKMSVHLGRILEKDEQVDHIDGNKSNDNIDNLQVLSQKENLDKSIVERSVKRTVVDLQCPWCDIVFFREKRNTHISKKGIYTSCSRSCSGNIDRYKQLNGSESITNMIKGNVINIRKVK